MEAEFFQKLVEREKETQRNFNELSAELFQTRSTQ